MNSACVSLFDRDKSCLFLCFLKDIPLVGWLTPLLEVKGRLCTYCHQSAKSFYLCRKYSDTFFAQDLAWGFIGVFTMVVSPSRTQWWMKGVAQDVSLGTCGFLPLSPRAGGLLPGSESHALKPNNNVVVVAELTFLFFFFFLELPPLQYCR